MEALIRIHNLDLSYRSQQSLVLNDFCLEVEVGKSVFIKGVSGSGKTSLLNVMAGFLKPDKGSVEVLGHSLGSMTKSQRDQLRGTLLGVVYQRFNLIPYLTVLQNVKLQSQLHGLRQGGDSSLALELLEQLGMSLFQAKLVKELSVGQQQRVAIARALHMKPKLILADEPTSALDDVNAELVVKILLDYVKQNQAALILASHDLRFRDLFDDKVDLL